MSYLQSGGKKERKPRCRSEKSNKRDSRKTNSCKLGQERDAFVAKEALTVPERKKKASPMSERGEEKKKEN